jgi:hypothetical protein
MANSVAVAQVETPICPPRRRAAAWQGIRAGPVVAFQARFPPLPLLPRKRPSQWSLAGSRFGRRMKVKGSALTVV